MRNESSGKTALRDATADQVKAMILNGDYAPGDPIRECDVAKKLNVSRAPVREVFRFIVFQIRQLFHYRIDLLVGPI